MVNGPVPGMLKLMLSRPAAAFAAVIASRNVHSVGSQVPVPGSAVEFTVKVKPAGDGENALLVDRAVTTSRVMSAIRGLSSQLRADVRLRKEIGLAPVAAAAVRGGFCACITNRLKVTSARARD